MSTQKQLAVVNACSEGKLITNKVSDVNVWNYSGVWTGKASEQPEDYFKSRYPYVKRIQFMTATGGSEERDFFKDPMDRSVLDDYDFSPIISAIHNVLKQGLKVFIITGNVPLKLSSEPVKSDAFHVNLRPPDDYDEYYKYIKALADALLAEFGIDKAKQWTWGVLTEYENGDWFRTADGDPESTKIAYFKLYDYTVAALQDSIGSENLFVGAHSMSAIEGLWEEEKFIEHCGTGINYKTGEKGTQINFLTASFYDFTPDNLSTRTLTDCIDILRNKAVAAGLDGLMYGVDEGRLLRGNDNKELTSRVIAHSYQASYDARMLKTMVEHDIDWFASWPFTTEGIWGGVDPVNVHVAQLFYRMVGEKQLSAEIGGEAGGEGNEVGVFASLSSDKDVMHVLIYNFNKDINSEAGEALELEINSVIPAHDGSVEAEEWLIDDGHANFWPAWWADQEKRGLTDDAYHWSKYSVQIPSRSVLKHDDDREFWYSNEEHYKKLSELKSSVIPAQICSQSITIPVSLGHHGVAFYEIRNIKAEK